MNRQYFTIIIFNLHAIINTSPKMIQRSGIAAFCTLVILLLSCSGVSNPQVLIKTEYGDISVELYADRAPVTVMNFLRYVDSSLFSNSSFYRIVKMDNQPHDSVKIEVIQGGRFEDEDNGFAPVIHEGTNETGIRHLNGVISMARTIPGSATSEFFICIGDQPELDFGGMRNKDGNGFAAFGKVISGMDVVKRIHNLRAPDQYLEKRVKIFGIERRQR
jgi:peptidyl-prolyl cis-trans isomerase A (cyclophilin A)